MKSNYSAFLQRMIDKYEGGYGWDKADAGGPTKYGITCYRLAEHRGQKMDSMARWAPIVQAMTRQEAEDIYAKYYAAPCRFNDLPTGVDCVVLDYGVNSGPARAMAVLRAVTGATTNDDAVKMAKKMDADEIIVKMCDERLAFMKRLSNWSTFSKGWAARVADLKKYCLGLTAGKVVKPTVDLSNVPTPKAEPTKSNPIKTITQGTGASGAGAGASKVSGVPTFVAIAVFVAGVVAVCVYAWRKHKQAKYEAAIIIP